MRRRKNRRHAKARRRNPLSSLAWVVNSGRKRRKKHRKANPRKRSRARRRRGGGRPIVITRTRTIRVKSNPKRRRRRRNPGAMIHLRRHNRRVMHHRRRNPGLIGSILQPVKEYGPSAVSASLVDLFGADPLLSGMSQTVRGPLKIVLYPLVFGLLGRLGFIGRRPKVSAFLTKLSVFGMAFGIKDTVSNLLGTPQAKMQGLADAYTARLAQQARAQRGAYGGYGGMRYIPTPAGMRFIPSAQQARGLGFIPSAGMGRMAGMGAMNAQRRY